MTNTVWTTGGIQYIYLCRILYLGFNKCKFQMTNTDKVWTTVGMQHNAVTMEALWSFWEESHPIRWYQRNLKPSHQTLFDLKHFSGFGQRVLFLGISGGNWKLWLSSINLFKNFNIGLQMVWSQKKIKTKGTLFSNRYFTHITEQQNVWTLVEARLCKCAGWI